MSGMVHTINGQFVSKVPTLLDSMYSWLLLAGLRLPKGVGLKHELREVREQRQFPELEYQGGIQFTSRERGTPL